MVLSNSVKVKCAVNDSALAELRKTTVREMVRIAAGCVDLDDAVSVSGINNSFGSILRNDVTTIRITPSKDSDGYVLEAITRYTPSVFFWIFFILDLLLTVTIIGVVIGLGATLGLYFYNKNLVQEGIKQALSNISNTMNKTTSEATPAPSDGACPGCGTVNEKGTKFCASCGAKLTVDCPKCGAKLAIGAKFCPECGEQLGGPKKCPKCGSEIPEGKKFCPDCGTAL